MFVSMKSMLQHAHENNYAIMACNCVNMELVKAIVSAAVEEESPVIINISPRQANGHATPELMVPMIKAYAKSVKVPIALNLDHGMKYDDITKAIRLGYTSIMFDGSSLPYEDNVTQTRLYSLMAHEYGISIEAELGHVGKAQAGDNEKIDYLTNPMQAKDFISRTQIDCLAVAIGTAHGNYPQGYVPTLDFERLTNIKKTTNIPLVLHGGSGAGEENIRKAVKGGINKINVCTDLFNYGRDELIRALKENPHLDYMDVQHLSELKLKEYIQNYMRLIGSSGRYRDLSMKTGRTVE